MQCPVCTLDQVIVEYAGVELDLCVDGCGTWFDAQELRQLFESVGAPDALHDLEERLVDLRTGLGGPKRRCPRCRGTMRRVRAPGPEGDVILDRCRRGHGLWFDQGELEEILALRLEGDDAALAKVKEFLGTFEQPGEGPAPAAPATEA